MTIMPMLVVMLMMVILTIIRSLISRDAGGSDCHEQDETRNDLHVVGGSRLVGFGRGWMLRLKVGS